MQQTDPINKDEFRDSLKCYEDGNLQELKGRVEKLNQASKDKLMIHIDSDLELKMKDMYLVIQKVKYQDDSIMMNEEARKNFFDNVVKLI